MASRCLCTGRSLLFALMGWEHGAYLTFGIPALICVGLAFRPSRSGAVICSGPLRQARAYTATYS